MARTRKDGTPYAEKGPELRWDDTRELALVTTIANYLTDGKCTLTPAEIASKLASHSAFADVEDGAITASKVRLKVIGLRDGGADIPDLKRAPSGGGGFARTKRTPDYAALNAILNAAA